MIRAQVVTRDGANRGSRTLRLRIGSNAAALTDSVSGVRMTPREGGRGRRRVIREWTGHRISPCESTNTCRGIGVRQIASTHALPKAVVTYLVPGVSFVW